MDMEVRKRIWNAVDNTPNFNNNTYWDNYRLVKSLKLGHRPTKEETDEVMFYSVAKVIGNGDANTGIKKCLEQFKITPLEN